MQYILNLLYNFIYHFFSFFGPISAPSWFVTFFPLVLRYFFIANYFLPLGTFFSVAISCLGFHAFVCGITIVLELF